MGFHPGRNFQKASVVVTGQETLFTTPAEISDGTNFVNTWIQVVIVVNFKVIDCVRHENLISLVEFLGGFDFQDEIEIGSELTFFGVEGDVIFLVLLLAIFTKLSYRT